MNAGDNMKRLSIILILTMVITALIGSGTFAAATTQQEQAEVLKAIKIFKGDENGFNLSGRLRRSEAAALIVRMLGEESKVVGNKKDYTVSVFPDVKDSDWYSSYVGYCYRNGIILGFEDGTFKPNDYISEKAFAQLVLGVMGYKSGTDFTWDTVKRFMYDKKLVTDIDYTINKDDNTTYSRGEAVTLLYNSLTKKRKAGDKTVCEVLIDRNVTNQPTAKKYGLIKYDETQTVIEKVTVIDDDSIEVEFNESVIVDAMDVEVRANGNELDITDFETKGETIIIEVDGELYNERDFKIEFLAVYDSEDNLTEDLSKEFSGIERPEIESQLFVISRVRPVSAEMLEINFTQPIDDSAEQVLLYQVYKNGALYFEGGYKTLDIELNSTIDHGLIFISKQYQFEEGNKYEIRIKGDLKSKYNAYLNDGNGDSYAFYGSAIKSGEFKIKKAEFLDTDNIVVEFSDVVDKESATDKSNYHLMDEDNKKISVQNAYLDEYDEDKKYKRVILKTQDLKEYHEYRLFIDDVDNIFKTLRIENYEADLGEGMTNDEEIDLDGIEVVNRSLIKLEFENPLDEDSEKSTITFSHSISVKKKMIDPENPRVLNLYLSKSRYLKEDREYTMTIKKGIYNIYGNTHKNEIVEEFDGTNEIRNEIFIEDAHFISDSQILVKFSDYVKETSVDKESNYTFKYEINGKEKELFASDIEVVDPRTVILDFDYFIQGGKLYVEINNVYDISGQFQYNDLEEKVKFLES